MQTDKKLRDTRGGEEETSPLGTKDPLSQGTCKPLERWDVTQTRQCPERPHEKTHGLRSLVKIFTRPN